MVIHPDDLTKIKKICFEDRYTCVDVQFQYLIIENHVLSFRVLPQYFMAYNVLSVTEPSGGDSHVHVCYRGSGF